MTLSNGANNIPIAYGLQTHNLPLQTEFLLISPLFP